MLNWPTGSTRRLPSPLALIVVGLLIGSIGAALMVYGDRWTRGMMRWTSDYLMLSEIGPQLGMRSDPGDIVIVEYGKSSAERLKTKATVETDRKVYENLLAAGAKGVADTRIIAALLPEDFEVDGWPVLEMMANIDGGRGRLVRDLMFGSMVDYKRIRLYDDYIRHNGIALRAPLKIENHSRFAPLVDHDLFRLRESLEIWLAARDQGLNVVTEEEVKAAISQFGIAGYWVAAFPTMTNLLEGCDFEAPIAPVQLGDKKIYWTPFENEFAQVAPAAVWVDHTQRPYSFPTLTYGEVAEDDFDKSIIKDKLVLIGLDRDFVRFGATFGLPNQQEQVGVSTVVALAAQTIISDRMMKPLPAWLYWLPPIVLALLVSLLVGRGSVKIAVLSGFAVFVGYFVAAAIGYRNSWYTDMAVTPSVVATAGLLTGLMRYGYEIRWRNRMTDLFGRYVPRAVVADLISQRALQSIAVGGKRRDVSVMFADIRGFTRFTESNQPETVLDRLNEFLQVMVDCTFENDGTVDKFIGDAILVLFNAPTDQPDHAQRAVKTAWAIQKRLAEMIDDYQESDLRIGIGIHTGEAIVGTVGTPQRMEYTAIGSTVNTASRLCDRADGGKVVVSQEVVDAVGDTFVWNQNEPMTVKGIDRPLQTATLVGLANPNAG
ncbi:MAG: adenylate/guanylate cyclase domain-containing protein [Pirellulaceae bacterium]